MHQHTVDENFPRFEGGRTPRPQNEGGWRGLGGEQKGRRRKQPAEASDVSEGLPFCGKRVQTHIRTVSLSGLQESGGVAKPTHYLSEEPLFFRQGEA